MRNQSEIVKIRGKLKSTKRATISVALATATSLLLTGCSAQQPESEPLVFVGVPVDEGKDPAESYRIMMDLVSEATGREVTFYQAQDYATATEALISGQVDVAVLSVFSYVLATSQNDQIDLLATVARAGGDLPGAFSYGIKRAGDPAVTTLNDLKGKKVCFSDPASGVGYFWPAYSMLEAGIDPDPIESEDYSAIFSGTFPQVAVAVANGDCDAGFILDAIFDSVLPNSDLVDVSKLEKFWTSPVLPGLPLVVNSARIDQASSDSIKSIMLERGNKTALVSSGVCENEKDCPFLSAAAWGFVEKEESFYEPLRDLCARLEISQCSR